MPTDASVQLDSKPNLLERAGYLLLILPPMTVLVLSYMLFACSDPDAADLRQDTQDASVDLEPDQPRTKSLESEESPSGGAESPPNLAKGTSRTKEKSTRAVTQWVVEKIQSNNAAQMAQQAAPPVPRPGLTGGSGAMAVATDNGHDVTSTPPVTPPGASAGAPSKPKARRLLLEETAARYSWFTTVVLFLVITTYASVFSGWIIYRTHRSTYRLKAVAGAAAILMAFGLWVLLMVSSSDSAIRRAVFAFTYESLQASRRFDEPFLRSVLTIISSINVIAVIGPVIVLLAACSAVAPPVEGQRRDPHYLARQMRNLKDVLNVASAVLVSGILHMGAWLHWPTTLVGDKETQASIRALAQSITMFWGATFSLLIIAAYIPAAIALCSWARTAIRQTVNEDDTEKWLNDHGFALASAQRLPQFLVMMAPMVVGPVFDKFLGGLTGSLG